MPADAAPVFLPQEVWDKEIASSPASTVEWILPGFIARGSTTLLTSLWKAGKTTLLAHLMARRVNGQPLFGLSVAPGKTVVISEESRALWADRCRAFDFGGRVCLFPQPFPHLPSKEQWAGLLDRVGRLRDEHGIDLLVVDSLTHFLRGESTAAGVLDLLMPVRALTGRGMAALLLHHPRRLGGLGVSGRGHGALHTEVEISIEMRHAGGDLDGRARQFFCLSRHAETPRRFRFALAEDGRDYTVLPAGPHDLDERLETLYVLLETAPRKLTRFDLLAAWPAECARPDAGTLARWLKDAVAAGRVRIEGSGRKTDPYRYWVAGAEARWRQDPVYAMREQQGREWQRALAMLSRGAGVPAAAAGEAPPSGETLGPTAQ